MKINKAFLKEHIEYTVDPLKEYTGVPEVALFEAMGLIPLFVFEAAMSDYRNDTAQGVYDVMMEAYGMGFPGNMLDHGGTIDDEGRYTYPEDPELAPIGEFRLDTGVTVWVYHYAVVAVVDDDGNKLMTRMD